MLFPLPENLPEQTAGAFSVRGARVNHSALECDAGLIVMPAANLAGLVLDGHHGIARPLVAPGRHALGAPRFERLLGWHLAEFILESAFPGAGAIANDAECRAILLRVYLCPAGLAWDVLAHGNGG